jgi:hypothetical protein
MFKVENHSKYTSIQGNPFKVKTVHGDKPFINVLRWNSVQNSRMCKDRNQSFFKNVQGGNPFKVEFGSSNINVRGVNRFIFHKHSR